MFAADDPITQPIVQSPPPTLFLGCVRGSPYPLSLLRRGQRPRVRAITAASKFPASKSPQGSHRRARPPSSAGGAEEGGVEEVGDAVEAAAPSPAGSGAGRGRRRGGGRRGGGRLLPHDGGRGHPWRIWRQGREQGAGGDEGSRERGWRRGRRREQAASAKSPDGDVAAGEETGRGNAGERESAGWEGRGWKVVTLDHGYLQ